MHMRRLLTVLLFMSAIIVTGCQSHQAKVDELQKDYDTKANQFQRDCSAEYLKIPPTLSPKCQDEKKSQADAWTLLQNERAKK
jgi:hypothetical protein